MTKRTIHSKELFKNVVLPTDYFPPIIIGCKIKTPENIGNIIRLADNAGCKKVIFIFDDENIRESKIKKTASSSYNSVDWEFCNVSELKNKVPKDYKWIAIETTSDSTNIYQTELPEKIAFIVGNEVAGIDDEILDLCNKIIHIPILGKNTSLNVSHALAIALFEWQRQICFCK